MSVIATTVKPEEFPKLFGIFDSQAMEIEKCGEYEQDGKSLNVYALHVIGFKEDFEVKLKEAGHYFEWL